MPASYPPRGGTPLTQRRRHLALLYAAWLALTADPGITIRQLAAACGLRSSSHAWSLIAELAESGLVTYAPHCTRARRVEVPLVRVGDGWVGWWIGD